MGICDNLPFLHLWGFKCNYANTLFAFLYPLRGVSQVSLMVKNQPASDGHVRAMGSIPGSGRSPGEGNGNPPQHSCLENPWTEEPGSLKSIPSQRVEHNWSNLARMHARSWETGRNLQTKPISGTHSIPVAALPIKPFPWINKYG